MRDIQVLQMLNVHNLPPRPDDLDQQPIANQKLWLLCQKCWKFEGSERPSLTEIEDILNKINPVRYCFLKGR